MKWFTSFYVLLLLGITIYSYGFVDPNLVLSTHPIYRTFHQPLFELVYNNRPLSTIIFILLIFLSSIFYLLCIWLAARKRLVVGKLKWLIGITTGILLLSYPAFSYDIFNYIFTAKVAFFYHENPYLVMPIEFIGDPNLAFTRAANKIALYGPSWIMLTSIPYILGLYNIVLTIFSFKLFIAAFYVLTSWLIWKMSKSVVSVALFALNPLVLIETLVSAHNDIVMMFFALLAFYLLQKKKVLLAIIMLVASILIKYATLSLIPIFTFALIRTWQDKKINWSSIFHLGGWSMLVILFLSPLREELYPWYVMWVLSFAALIPHRRFFLSIALTLSFAALLRYTPVLYTGSYFGATPIVREIVTFVPLFVVLLFWVCKKVFLPKFYQL